MASRILKNITDKHLKNGTVFELRWIPKDESDPGKEIQCIWRVGTAGNEFIRSGCNNDIENYYMASIQKQALLNELNSPEYKVRIIGQAVTYFVPK
jgi:hypothetical protein